MPFMKVIAVVLAGCLSAAAVRAQAPAVSATLDARAISESLAVLAQLDRAVRANPRDSAAWYRRGMVGWALLERARASDRPANLDPTRLGRLADTSLRIAVQSAPANVTYKLTLGRFLLGTRVSITRRAATGFFESALALARTQDSPSRHADAALEYGRTFWRQYEDYANRRMLTGNGDIGRSLSDAMQPLARGVAALEKIVQDIAVEDAMQSVLQRMGMPRLATGSVSGTPDATSLASLAAAAARANIDALGPLELARMMGPDVSTYTLYQNVAQAPMKSVRDLIEASSSALPPDVAGGKAFTRADSLFREAYAADAAFPGAFRAVAMILVEKARWSDLEVFAREHLADHAADGLAWLSIGLALHRQSRPQALAVFDTALALLGPEERARLDDMTRVVGPGRIGRLSQRADRESFARMYWLVSNPLWSTRENVPRAEFLARVTYAELRWTVEEFGIHGADTDRGDVHIRYGPPDMTAVFGTNLTENAADIMTFWMYRSGLMFAFTSAPGFATARIPNADEAMFQAMRLAQPARYDNIPIPRPDTILTQIVRFRAPGDSVDVYVGAALPADKVRATASDSVARGDIWMLTTNTSVAYHDTLTLETPRITAWTPRVAVGQYLMRVEVTGSGSPSAARAAHVVDTEHDFARSGAGISDVLLAAAVRGPDAATRWNALDVVPLVGVVEAGAELAILWENYEFAERDGRSQYTINLTLKKEAAAEGSIAARILGEIANIARSQPSSDRLVIEFDRDVPHRLAFADRISVGLGDSPAGRYSLTVQITDRISNRVFTRRAAEFTVRKPVKPNQ
jgi:GWxTD domain-containing protein